MTAAEGVACGGGLGKFGNRVGGKPVVAIRLLYATDSVTKLPKSARLKYFCFLGGFLYLRLTSRSMSSMTADPKKERKSSFCVTSHYTSCKC